MTRIRNRKVIGILLAVSMIVCMLAVCSFSASAATSPFKDVPAGKWFTDAVNSCAQKGYVSGYENGTFRPDNKLTRAEMAVIMNKMMNLKDSGSNSFKDVPSGKWYTDAILHCVKAGVMTGYSASEFGTNDTLTREQGAVILAKAFNVSKASGRTTFADDATISSWAVESVKAMAAKGLISGMGDNKFAPKTPLTRAQMCQIIYAAQEKNKDKEEEQPKPTETVTPDVPEEPIHAGDVENETTKDDWKTLQEKYLDEDGVVGANMIDVDGDANEEMVLLGEKGTGNDKLITYHDGNVSILPLNGAALGYVPGGNAILVGEYEDGNYTVSIYSIESGKWAKKAAGSYSDPEGGPATDEEGYDVYVNFKWNGKTVSEEEFYTSLAEMIDVEKLVETPESED